MRLSTSLRAFAPLLFLLLAGCAGAGISLPVFDDADSTAVAPDAPLPPLEARGKILASLESPEATQFPDILSGRVHTQPKISVPAELFMPPNRRYGERVPAIIMVHGSGGISQRDYVYVNFFNRLGIATLRIDSFTPRGVNSTVGQQDAVSEASMFADAVQGLAWLAGRDDINPDKIGIIGWSKGGGVALLTAWQEARQAFVGTHLRFAARAAYYPPCFVDLSPLNLSSVPVHIFAGAADVWTGAEPCRDFVRRLGGKNVPVKLSIYPGAHHSFDRPGVAADAPNGFNYTECRWQITPAGLLAEEASGALLESPEDVTAARDQCATPGARVEYNFRAASASQNDLRGFMRLTLLAP